MRWIIAVILGLSVLAGLARAQTDSIERPPINELRLLVSASPGGGYDRTAQAVRRTLLNEGLVSTINVEYSPGAGGLIGLAQFVESEPVGAPTLLISGRTALGATLHNRSTVSVKDAMPLARLVSPSISVIVPLNSEIQSIEDLADILREDADLVSWYGGSAGSFDELVVRALASAFEQTGDQVTYNAVPGGGDAVIEQLESSDLAVAVSSFEEVADAVESGRVKILALTAKGEGFTGSAPSFIELGITLEESDWRGAFAHPRATDAQLDQLSELLATMVETESWKTKLRAQYWTDVYLPDPAFSDFIDADWQLIQTRSESVGSSGDQSARAGTILQRRQRLVRLGFVAIVVLLAGLAALYLNYRRQRRKWLETFDEFTEETRLMQEKLDKSHGDMAAHINGEFEKWNLTETENEIGWMLLKGLSFKDIATARGRSERTVRQQAQSIYAKSKLQSRSDLAAHFLEDFVFGAAELNET